MLHNTNRTPGRMPIKVPLNNSSKINLPIILIFYNIPVLDIHLIVYLIMYTIIYLIYLIIDLTMCSIIYLIILGRFISGVDDFTIRWGSSIQ